MLNVFISYAHEDRTLRQELEKHLSNLKRQGIINSWHDGDILPGTPWQAQIIDHLNTADIILLLISSDFMASDFCYSIQMQQALTRHHTHKTHVIPILLRPTDWEQAPFAELAMLPDDGRAITQWPSHDEAFANVVRGIRKIVPVSHLPQSALNIQHGIPTFVELQTSPKVLYQPMTAKIQTPDMPATGIHFLESQDRTWLINIVSNIIEDMSISGMKNLLREILPDSLINRISFREAFHNIAESMVDRLETRGPLKNQQYHALGTFLLRVIDNDLAGYDAFVHMVVLIFRYVLVTEKQRIEQLSECFQVPIPIVTTEQRILNPIVPSATYRNSASAAKVIEQIESLYHHQSYLLKVPFLSSGAKMARSVCRVDFDMRGEGTGFLVAPDLILTSYHVMIPPGYKGDINARAQRCELQFGLIEGTTTRRSFTLHPTDWRQAESPPEQLDFLLLKLQRPVTANDHIEPLISGSHTIQKDDYVNILQHPAGRSMEVSLRNNQVIGVTPTRIYYLADTEEGSSGSPVFNDSWQLVGLHHAGGELDKGGKLVKSANIGVPIYAIYNQISSLLQ